MERLGLGTDPFPPLPLPGGFGGPGAGCFAGEPTPGVRALPAAAAAQGGDGSNDSATGEAWSQVPASLGSAEIQRKGPWASHGGGRRKEARCVGPQRSGPPPSDKPLAI